MTDFEVAAVQAEQEQELQVSTPEQKYLITISTTEVQVAELEKFTALTIDGIEDEDGYKVVHTAEKQVRKTRTGMEKERKAKKAPLLAAIKDFDGAVKGFSTRLVAVEDHLKDERGKVDDELDRIAQAEAAARKRVIESRVKQIQQVGGFLSFDDAEAQTDEEYAAMLQHETEAYDQRVAELETLNREAADRQKEADEAIERVRVENVRKEKELADRENLQRQEDERRKQEQDAREEAFRLKQEAWDAAHPPDPVVPEVVGTLVPGSILITGSEATTEEHIDLFTTTEEMGITIFEDLIDAENRPEPPGAVAPVHGHFALIGNFLHLGTEPGASFENTVVISLSVDDTTAIQNKLQ